MDTTMTAPRARADRRPSALSTLVAAALVGIALSYVYLQAVLIGELTMPLPIFSVISLLLAALVAGRPVGGWRWAPLLGPLWATFLLLGKLDLVLYELAHPENTHQFAWQLVMLSLVTTATVGGVAGAIQNYRRPAHERRLPPWVRWGYVAMAGLFVGALAVAAIPQAGSGAQVSPEALAQLPAVPIEAFDGGEIRVRAGQLTALRLENPDPVGHSFDVDELDLHVTMPAGSDSVALFTAPAPGVYTFYCAPHYDKATGQGMRGTLVVEP